MEKFYCRGKEKRIRLVEKYEITPISRTVLLNGQIKHSAAGDTITREYYCFSYKERNTNNKTDTFIVGTFAAKHFLELLKIDSFPIFNILKSDENFREENNYETILSKEEKWNPLALELNNVINIILIMWDKIGGTLAEILVDIRKNYSKEPYLRYIKSVNTIISKDHNNRTVYNMLDVLRGKNKIKEYDFPLIDKILLENGIKNYITGNGK